MIREAREQDATALAAIYAPYVLETHITFDEVPPTADDFVARLRGAGPRHPWLVLELAGAVSGYANATPWKTRSAYAYTVECGIYLSASARGSGHGTRLYRELLSRLEAASVRTAIAGIALPNQASVALHEKLGFLTVGTLHDVGWKFDRWIDVALLELRFPRQQ